MEGFFDFFATVICAIVLTVVVLALIIAPIVGLNVYFEKGKCKQFTAMHSDDFEFQWVFYGGCMVKTPDGRWVDASQYLQLEISQ